MILPVQKLVRQTVSASGTYEFVVETLIPTRFVLDAWLVFHNPDCDSCELRIQYTAAQTSIFSDSFDIVDQAVAKGALYSYEFKVPLVQSNSITSHSVRFKNDDVSDRAMYALITGFVDTKVTRPATVYAIT